MSAALVWQRVWPVLLTGLLMAWALRRLYLTMHWLYLRFRGLRAQGLVVLSSAVSRGGRGSIMPTLSLTVEYTAQNGAMYRRRVFKRCDLGNLPRPGDHLDRYVSRLHPADFVVASTVPIQR